MIKDPFGLAPIRSEGESVWDKELWGEPEPYKPPKYEYNYVERRIPVDLEDDVHNLIDQFLISKGIDLEEL